MELQEKDRADSVRLPSGETVTRHRQLSSLADLRGRWHALGGMAGTSAAQTYEYVAAGWRLAAERPGAELAVISVVDGDELLALWPLFIEPVGGLRIGRHLGCGGDEEYAGPLAASGPRGAAAVAQALAAAGKLADVLKIYNVRPQHVAASVLNDFPGLKYKGSVRSPLVSVPEGMTWEDWLATRSKSFRSGLRYDRKRLSQLGEVSFEQIVGEEKIRSAVKWIFDLKRQAVIRQGDLGSWVLRPQAEAFFIDAAILCDRVNIYALNAGNKISAASIVFESIDLLEYYTTSYDYEFQEFSPGNLLIEDLVRKGVIENKVFDFRITGEAYKLRWSNNFQEYNSYMISTSIRGVPAVVDHFRKRGVVALKKYAKKQLNTARQRVAGWTK